MARNSGTYSLITRLQIRGFPYEYCTKENVKLVAKGWGNILFSPDKESPTLRADTMQCLVEVYDPKPQMKWQTFG